MLTKWLGTGILCVAIVSCGSSSDATAVQQPPDQSGVGARRVFPADNWWNLDVSADPVDANSATLIAACGTANLHPDFGTIYGIPYVVVGAGQPKVAVSFDYSDESDAGPYPIPPAAPIEGGSGSSGDRHVLVVDSVAWKLYELYDAHPVNSGTSWHAGAGAIFDLSSNALRPLYWTSADAAGLPVFPGLVRYDEAVSRAAIDHAVRFTCPRTQKGFITPARHYASSDASPALPPMGMRVRLKSSFDISSYPADVQVILRAMKKYGMILADNGSAWYVSGAPDSRWNDDHLDAMKKVPSSAFEVVRMATITH